MGGALKKAIRWLVVAGLVIIGGRNTPEPSSTLEQPWRDVIPWPWLEANWVALACFVLAAVLAAYTPLKWWINRQNAKDVTRRIRTNPISGTFHETDIVEVLRYLLKESSWGWRQYARLNSWEMVDGLHLKEFRRAALAGDLLVMGFSSGKTVPIERRLWNGLEIDPGTLDARAPGSAFYLERPSFSDLAVASVELKQVWPPATYPQRALARLLVWVKTTFWYGSKLSNSLEERRRKQIKDRRLN